MASALKSIILIEINCPGVNALASSVDGVKLKLFPNVVVGVDSAGSVLAVKCKVGVAAGLSWVATGRLASNKRNSGVDAGCCSWSLRYSCAQCASAVSESIWDTALASVGSSRN